MIAYGAWRPDVSGPNTGVASVADGVVPQSGAGGVGYGPYPMLSTATGAVALSGSPRGIISLQKQDNTYKVYAATASTIEELQSDYSWSDIETGRTVTSGDDVSFCYFGKYLLNTDTTDGFKAYDVEGGGTNDAVSGAPAARFVFSASNVVFALGTSSNPRRMASTGVGSHTNWTGEGADGKTFEDGGALVAGGDLKNGAAIILQEKAVRLVQFGQGAALYGIAKVADGRGCVHARTFVSFDGNGFWWDVDGLWMFSMNGGLQPIGAEKINRWADENIGASNYANLQGAVDPARNLLVYRLNDTQLLAYNWLLKEFTTMPAATSALTRIATPGLTIDDLTGTIDDQTDVIDSRAWAGSAPVFGGLSTANKFATFTGSNMAATLETMTTNSGTSGLITWATPIDDADAGTLQIGVSDRLDDSLMWKTGAAKVTSGRVPLRARGKNIAFRRNIPAGTSWTYANGIDHINGAR